MARLSGSVGEGGRNGAPDVRYVQTLLADWQLAAERMPLKVDGICGPLTKAAILEFQRQATSVHDSRIDPGGPTIAALEQFHIVHLLTPLTGIAHYALISPMRSGPPALDENKQADRYLSALRQSFDQAPGAGGQAPGQPRR